MSQPNNPLTNLERHIRHRATQRAIEHHALIFIQPPLPFTDLRPIDDQRVTIVRKPANKPTA
ncbi:MAG: hypothetical protein ACYC3S_18090 [Chloroflexota bacterium]